MQNFERIILTLNAKKCGRGWVARCPAHDDNNPSLSLLKTPDGKTLMFCFAGCSYRDVLSALRSLGALK